MGQVYPFSDVKVDIYLNLLEIENVVLVPLRMLRIKRATAGVSVVPFKVLS